MGIYGDFTDISLAFILWGISWQSSARFRDIGCIAVTFGSWADLRDGAPHDETKNLLVVWGYIIIIIINIIIIIRYATGSILF